jgi:hypothetical protein
VSQLTETIIKLETGRDRLLLKVKRLAQFSVYVESVVTDKQVGDVEQILTALHHLQEELKVFDV